MPNRWSRLQPSTALRKLLRTTPFTPSTRGKDERRCLVAHFQSSFERQNHPTEIVMDDRKTYCTVWETPFSHRTQYATSEPSATRSNLVSMAWRQEACTYLQEASRVGLIELLTAQDASSLAFSALLMVPRSFHPRPLAATEEQLPLKAMSPQHLSNSSIAYCEKDR